MVRDTGPSGPFISEFGEEAFYTPSGGARRRVMVIFDHATQETDVGEVVQVIGQSAIANVATSDIPEVAINDELEVRGVSYRVVADEPDGTGMTRLVLALGQPLAP